MTTRHLTLILGATLLTTACGYIPFSGGALSGRETPPPTDWTQVAEAKIIELETNPTDPYSVKLWIIGAGPNLYVHAGANRTTWVEHIEADSRVRLLIDDALYLLRAQRVTDAGEFDNFAQAYDIKYGNRPRNESVDEAYLFRLTPRE